MSKTFFIGWDVGGWNCDRNGKSRDAIVILDQHLQVTGTPWRGNLRETINHANTSQEWLAGLFQCCGVREQAPGFCTLAIDTPLGFPKAFIKLVHDHRPHQSEIGTYQNNPYLFRKTDQYLFHHRLRPLSPLNDMIGSQATKGVHVLSRFAPLKKSCGVWTDGQTLQVIETYPSPCKRSQLITRLKKRYPPLGHEDIEDALICALVACLFSQSPETLLPPGTDIPSEEGWIWLPQDVFKGAQ